MESETFEEEIFRVLGVLKQVFSDASDIPGMRRFLGGKRGSLAEDLVLEAAETIIQKTKIKDKTWERRHGQGTSRPLKQQYPDLSWTNVERELSEIIGNLSDSSPVDPIKMSLRLLELDSGSRSVQVDAENYERIRIEVMDKISSDIVSSIIQSEIRKEVVH